MQLLPCTASMIVLGDILLLSYSKTRLVTVSLERGANEGRSRFHCKPPADNKNCWLGSSEPPAGPDTCCASSCETIVGAERLKDNLSNSVRYTWVHHFGCVDVRAIVLQQKYVIVVDVKGIHFIYVLFTLFIV